MLAPSAAMDHLRNVTEKKYANNKKKIRNKNKLRGGGGGGGEIELYLNTLHVE